MTKQLVVIPENNDSIGWEHLSRLSEMKVVQRESGNQIVVAVPFTDSPTITCGEVYQQFLEGKFVQKPLGHVMPCLFIAQAPSRPPIVRVNPYFRFAHAGQQHKIRRPWINNQKF